MKKTEPRCGRDDLGEFMRNDSRLKHTSQLHEQGMSLDWEPDR